MLLVPPENTKCKVRNDIKCPLSQFSESKVVRNIESSYAVQATENIVDLSIYGISTWISGFCFVKIAFGLITKHFNSYFSSFSSFFKINTGNIFHLHIHVDVDSICT